MFNFITESVVVGFLGGVIGAGIGAGLSFFIIGDLQSASGLSSLTGGGGTVAEPQPLLERLPAAQLGEQVVSLRRHQAQRPTTSITPAISPGLILLAIGLATVVGALAGLLPAWRASRMTPVEALKTS